jgi:hypothetical protein
VRFDKLVQLDSSQGQDVVGIQVGKENAGTKETSISQSSIWKDLVIQMRTTQRRQTESQAKTKNTVMMATSSGPRVSEDTSINLRSLKSNAKGDNGHDGGNKNDYNQQPACGTRFVVLEVA